MGDMTEMMLDGVICKVCGTYIDGHETGHPRSCEDCEEEAEKGAVSK